jgi:ABC-type amino acid transport substrate-binding protein/mono/diheme cytochrome c family protein
MTRLRRTTPSLLRAAAAAALLAATAALAQGGAAPPLRVCADPDNLPFSAAEGAARGMYVELAELVAARLGQPVAYTWWYTHYQRRAMRNTIQKGECDAMFALPATADFRARGVLKSLPFLDVGYALVSAPGLVVNTLESLKGRRVAVQFSSTPHVLLSTLGGYTTTTYKTPEEVFAALAKGEVEVGLLWGPVAGYENKLKHQGRWQVTPVAGHELSGQVVVGVRAGAEGLKARIDQALTDLQPQIRELAEKYGFPTAKPLDLQPRTGSAAPHAGPRHAMAAQAVPAGLWAAVNSSTPAGGAASAGSTGKPAPKPPAKPPAAGKPAGAKPAAAAGTAAAAAPAAPALDPAAQAGRVRFNDKCSHCHGSDGATPIRERDVRRMSMRYDAAKWQDVANTTIRNGRGDLGMPAWKDALVDKEIRELITFLSTIQK